MCGFVGGYSRNFARLKSDALNAALAILQHRGPDSQGQSAFDLESGVLHFGFRRLAIIDLSSSGNQPFTSSDQRFTMVFNGEIYNYVELKHELISKGHVFRSNSDSEVLITAWTEWGINAVNKFIGMFSLVIYDKNKSEIWCIRDAYGIKPFFYSFTNDDFFFASEISALHKIQNITPKMNEEIAIDYLIGGEYDRSTNTFFQNIFQLEPGHFFKVDLKNKEILVDSKRWWFPRIQENTSITFKAAAEELREHFLESIALHLRSDVRVATALSGGLDSSAIVSAIRKIEPDIDIHTFSYLADDPKINECQWIDIVNSETNSIPHLIEISPSQFQNDLDDLISSQGEPFGSTSLYAQYRVYKAAKDAGVTVMLDGQGADELLAGYFGYPESRIQSLIDGRKYASAIALINNWSNWPGRQPKGLIKSSAKYLLPKELQRTLSSALELRRIPDFINKEFVAPVKISDVYARSEWKNRRLSERLLKEQSNGALIALLRVADRNSMRWSIESRVPFLNTKLSELVLSFPERYLLNNQGETKSVFREAMRGIVDDKILDRKDKVGFATPQNKWMTRDLITKSSVLDGVKEIDFLDYGEVKAMLSNHKYTSNEGMDTSWRLFNLVKWKQLMGI